MKLPAAFYQETDVVKVARGLLGKGFFTRIDGVVTGGMIVETEAYSWREKGCHAYGARKTPRNAIMFGPGGFAYVYLCYGIHHLFNVVTNGVDTPEAVLVRALQPLEGLETMCERRGKKQPDRHLTSGPGKLTKALGIGRSFNGKSLRDDEIWIEDCRWSPKPQDIEVGERIGIAYAGEDALLPWRFALRGNPWVSQPRVSLTSAVNQH